MGKYDRKSALQKKKFCVTLMISLLIGGTCLLQGEAASADQAEDVSDPKTELLEGETGNSSPEDTEPAKTDTAEQDLPEPEVPNQEEPKAEGQDSEAAETENSDPEVQENDSSQELSGEEEVPEVKGLTCLQIPEKLEVVIDPWEIDEKTQIYSEPFIIKNAGDTAGILTLSFSCKTNEEEGVSARKTREGLHDSEEKEFYIKVMLGNGKEVVFTEEGVQCQAELPPGEELSLWFEGEVNENAEEPWISGDLEIEGKYSWEKEEIPFERAEKKDTETDQEENLPPATEKEVDDPSVETEKEPIEEVVPPVEMKPVKEPVSADEASKEKTIENGWSESCLEEE